jgi:hypothetical protein
MTFLELFPVYVAIRLWSAQLANKRILFHIDNSAVVQVINSATSKSIRVMRIVRKLVLITLQHNISIQAQYIPSKHNDIADSISRSEWRRFRQLAPKCQPVASRPTKPNMGHLKAESRRLINNALSVNTIKAYNTALNKFHAFGVQININISWPLPLDLILVSLHTYRYKICLHTQFAYT